MRLSREEFVKYVNLFEEMIEEENTVIDTLNINPEWIGSRWIGNFYDFLTDMCDLDREDIYGNDLDWYCFDTNFGKRKDLRLVEETATGRTWNIKDANALYSMITGWGEEE